MKTNYNFLERFLNKFANYKALKMIENIFSALGFFGMGCYFAVMIEAETIDLTLGSGFVVSLILVILSCFGFLSRNYKED